MIGFIVKKIIGSKNEREVKKLRPLVEQINAFEADLQKLPDDALRQKTTSWKEELSKIQDNDELARRLKEVLPEAFAVVKNACRRLWGNAHFREKPLDARGTSFNAVRLNPGRWWRLSERDFWERF